MMYEKGDAFIPDFIARTKCNYELVKSSRYEVTQLINSAVGLLILPKEKLFLKLSDNFVSQELLDKLKGCITTNTYTDMLDLGQIARHMRNAIAHGRMEFAGEKAVKRGEPPVIQAAIFSDHADAKGKKPEADFVMDIPIDLLREFFFEFSEAAVKAIKKK